MRQVAVTVLFCDVVSFSKGTEQKQVELIADLNKTIATMLWAEEDFTTSDDHVIVLPTGDGMAIVMTQWDCGKLLFSMIEKLMDWANNKAGIRLAIHQGTVFVVRDVNRSPNVCGYAINECQRILAAAHPNQVLFSQIAFEHYSLIAENIAPGRFCWPVQKYEIVAKHDRKLYVAVLCRESSSWQGREPYPQYITDTNSALHREYGAERRAKYLVNRLDELKSVGEELVIYEQSTLSTFALVSLSKGSPEYQWVGYLLRQRELFSELSERPNVQMRLIVNPELTYIDRDSQSKLRSVIEAFEKVDRTRIKVALGQTYGINVLAVRGRFRIDGWSTIPYSGISFSRVYDERELPMINEACAELEKRFQDYHAECGDEMVLAELRSRLDKI